MPEFTAEELERRRNLSFNKQPTTPFDLKPVKEHYHKSRSGSLVECYHTCKSILTDYKFWLGTTFGFPLEHWLWEKVWPFTLLTELLGL
jgi:hypothetical protein